MHTFAAARRPRTVYGRIRGVHRSQRKRRESDSSYEESASQSSEQSSKHHPHESSEDEARAVEDELFKENDRSTLRSSQLKGKAKAAKGVRRRPMQQKSVNSTSGIPMLQANADKGETDDSDDGIIRSPQRRKGISTRPIVICSSPSGSSSSSQSSSHHSVVSLDDEADDSVHELTHRLRETNIRSDNNKDANPLDTLIASCDLHEIMLFDDALNSVQDLAGDDDEWEKIGEATYSEVFSVKGSNMVLKVIPLTTENVEDPDASLGQPERSSAVDVQREVSMTRALSETHRTFVTLHQARVVRGAYPDRLLRAWDEKRKKKKDQNARPDVFADDSLFCLLVLSDGGQDLESFRLASWSQAASVIVQVAQALASAEKECKFEHRDLHWGNVVVKEAKQGRVGKSKTLGITLLASPRWSGVQATIIDFTLSRAVLHGDEVVYHPLDDEAFFKGEGDIQFDVYRAMRRETRENWQSFQPYTNVLWMRYLIAKIIDAKHLKPANTTREDDDIVDMDAECYTVLSSVRDTLDDDVKHATAEEREIVNVQSLCDRMASMLQPGGDSSTD